MQQYILINDISQEHLIKRVQNFINLFERDDSVDYEIKTTLTATIFSYQENAFVVQLSRTIDEITFLFLGYHIRFPGEKGESPNVRGWLTIPEDSTSLKSLRGKRCLFWPTKKSIRMDSVILQFEKSHYYFYRFNWDDNALRSNRQIEFEEELLDQKSLVPLAVVKPNDEPLLKSLLYFDGLKNSHGQDSDGCLTIFFAWLIGESLVELPIVLLMGLILFIGWLTGGC